MKWRVWSWFRVYGFGIGAEVLGTGGVLAPAGFHSGQPTRTQVVNLPALVLT